MGLEPTTLRLKAARSTDWARRALTLCSYFPSPSIPLLPCLFLLLKRGLWRESNPRHLHPKQVFYHLTTKPCYFSLCCFFSSLFPFKKGASPGIEPGPLAPEASILPLNYEAFCLFLPIFLFFSALPILWKNWKGHNRIRTNDRGNCSPTLYHWAMRPTILFLFLLLDVSSFLLFLLS